MDYCVDSHNPGFPTNNTCFVYYLFINLLTSLVKQSKAKLLPKITRSAGYISKYYMVFKIVKICTEFGPLIQLILDDSFVTMIQDE